MILTIDGGVTTGLVWCEDPLKFFKFGGKKTEWNGRENGFAQIKESEEHYSISRILRGIDYLHSVYGLDVVVTEDFIPGKTRNTKREVYAPVRINAVIHYYMREKWFDDIRLITDQTPSQKSMMTNERLQHYGLWTPTKGMQHARDAMRHLLLFCLREYTSG